MWKRSLQHWWEMIVKFTFFFLLKMKFSRKLCNCLAEEQVALQSIPCHSKGGHRLQCSHHYMLQENDPWSYNQASGTSQFCTVPSKARAKMTKTTMQMWGQSWCCISKPWRWHKSPGTSGKDEASHLLAALTIGWEEGLRKENVIVPFPLLGLTYSERWAVRWPNATAVSGTCWQCYLYTVVEK